METLIILLVAVVLLIAALYAFKVSKSRQIEPAHEAREKTHQENKAKIIDFLQENAKISNNDVERILGVKDSMAYKYLEELEQEGRIKQIGTTGKFVHYSKV